jgi:hypothetical protein
MCRKHFTVSIYVHATVFGLFQQFFQIMQVMSAYQNTGAGTCSYIYNIAWYEQKAVIVLLALLSLGIKEIHLGPTLPAFLSPNVTKVLVENFGVSGIGTVESDMRKWGLTNE